MVIQRLEKEGQQRNFINAPGRRREKKEAGGFFHEQYTARETDEKQEEPTVADSVGKGERTERMKEIFHTDNAYGKLTLLMDENADSVFTVTRKVHADIRSTEQTERSMEPLSVRNYHILGDEIRTNVRKPVESAYAYVQRDKERGHPDLRAREIIRGSQEFARATGQHALLSFFPQKDSSVGATKEKSAEELKLEHRLSLAIELGERQVDSKN